MRGGACTWFFTLGSVNSMLLEPLVESFLRMQSECSELEPSAPRGNRATSRRWIAWLSTWCTSRHGLHHAQPSYTQFFFRWPMPSRCEPHQRTLGSPDEHLQLAKCIWLGSCPYVATGNKNYINSCMKIIQFCKTSTQFNSSGKSFLKVIYNMGNTMLILAKYYFKANLDSKDPFQCYQWTKINPKQYFAHPKNTKLWITCQPLKK